MKFSIEENKNAGNHSLSVNVDISYTEIIGLLVIIWVIYLLMQPSDGAEAAMNAAGMML